MLAALALLGGAGFAVLVGWTVQWLACENEGTEACARTDLALATYVLAIVGLVPAVVLLLAALFSKRRLAIGALAFGVLLYLSWALLLDAAVHGWDDLILVP